MIRFLLSKSEGMNFAIKEALDAVAYPVYLATGRRPWRPGYYTAKKRAISGAVDRRLLADGQDLPVGTGYRIDERAIEYPWVFSQLPAKPGKLLDAGSALNHSFLIKRSPLNEAKVTIMTLAPEKRCFWDRGISYVFGDLRSTNFCDASFDVVVSVSTIEHIGLDNTLLYTADAALAESDAGGFEAAVREFRRVLRPGGLCLITVPYGRRRVESWFQVFDADLVQRVLKTFQPTHSDVDYFGYAAQGWRRADAPSLAEAEFFDFHTDRSYGPDFAAGARGLACIRMVA